MATHSDIKRARLLEIIRIVNPTIDNPFRFIVGKPSCFTDKKGLEQNLNRKLNVLYRHGELDQALQSASMTSNFVETINEPNKTYSVYNIQPSA